MTCNHYPFPLDVFKVMGDYITYCPTCESPMLVSTLGVELDPNSNLKELLNE